MGNGKCGQMGIMVNTEDRDGAPWGMGYMGDGAHGWWGTWPMGYMDNGTHGQWDMGKEVSWLILKIEMGHLGGWGTWPMGHMANGAHGHNWGHMGNGKHGQRGIMVDTADRDGAP